MKADIGQWEFVDPTLRSLAIWLEKETGVEFTITSSYRIDDTGVHGTLPVRGMDLRIRNEILGRCIAMLVNAAWVYDPGREYLACCIPHGKGANYHLHLQVCGNTVRGNEFSL